MTAAFTRSPTPALMPRIVERLEVAGPGHLYEIEVGQVAPRKTIEVAAKTRAQAAAVAKAAGYVVASVNMVG